MRVISCSRRSDVPKWYSDWLFTSLQAGEAVIQSPRGPRRVNLSPESVHTLVLWSKDFGPVLRHPALRRKLAEYNLLFQFTITGLAGSDWEPLTPSPGQALAELKELCETWGPQRVTWRFDPVIVWRQGGVTRTNLAAFPALAAAVRTLGVTRCTFAFVDLYPKVRRRLSGRAVVPIESDAYHRESQARYLADVAAELDLSLSSCAEAFSKESGVKPGRCIDAALLQALCPDKPAPSHQKDPSQRPACRCTASIDIGSYTHRCAHGCLYCYANPAIT